MAPRPAAGWCRALTVFAACLPLAPAWGQPTSSAVDAGVADLDPRATSLRVLEPGIGQFDFATRLRSVDFGAGWGVSQGQGQGQGQSQPPAQGPRVGAPLAAWRDPATGLLHHQPRRYRAPGVRALVDRPRYVARQGPDGVVDPDAPQVAVVGANTVFELTPDRPAAPRPAAGPPPPGLLDTRLDLRVGGDTDLRGVGQRILATVPGATPRRVVRNGPAAGAPARTAAPAPADAPAAPDVGPGVDPDLGPGPDADAVVGPKAPTASDG